MKGKDLNFQVLQPTGVPDADPDCRWGAGTPGPGSQAAQQQTQLGGSVNSMLSPVRIAKVR